MVDYTEEDLSEFRRLVEMGESRDQLECISSRARMPTFVAQHGKEKCDAMFEVLKKEPLKKSVKSDGLIVSLAPENRAQLARSLRGLAEALEIGELSYKSGVIKVEYHRNDDGSEDLSVTSNLIMTKNRELH